MIPVALFSDLNINEQNRIKISNNAPVIRPQRRAEEDLTFAVMKPPKKADITRAEREPPTIRRLGSLKDIEIAEKIKDRATASAIEDANPIAMLFINRDTVGSDDS